MDMQRIAIIGSCGAGKSTLAGNLSNKLKLPVFHLDAYYWQPGWLETEADPWQRIQQELVKSDKPNGMAPLRWIIDGNYGNTLDIRLAAADTIIWLDFNRYLCLWRILKRAFQYLGKVRPDMAAGCPERLNWKFIKYVWNFSKLHRAKILDKVEQYRGCKQIIILQNPRQVLNLLQQTNALAE
jgi:adenylate kinase family enzyme